MPSSPSALRTSRTGEIHTALRVQKTLELLTYSGFDTSIFRVNRKISNEAIVEFLKNSTIRFRCRAASAAIPLGHVFKDEYSGFVRKIEFVGRGWFGDGSNKELLSRMLQLCVAMPKIQTITVAYDGLSNLFRSLEQHLRMLNQPIDVQFITFCHYKAINAGWEKTEFKHMGLIEAHKAPCTYSIEEEWRRAQCLRFLPDDPEEDIDSYFLSAPLRIWAKIYDDWRLYGTEDYNIVLDFFNDFLQCSSDVPDIHIDLASDDNQIRKLMDVVDGKHGKRLQKWGCDLLALNADNTKALVSQQAKDMYAN